MYLVYYDGAKTGLKGEYYGVWTDFDDAVEYAEKIRDAFDREYGLKRWTRKDFDYSVKRLDYAVDWTSDSGDHVGVRWIHVFNKK
jgi:hypothetical protein